jgi:uroporphyrinogen-III synthase
MPKEYVAESLVEAFTQERLSGSRVLLPRAAVARDLVPRELEKRGASVEVVEAYRAAAPADLAERAAEALARKPHWITFSSSSMVKNFVGAAALEALQGVKIASIGPVTSATLRDCGLTVDAEADPHTVPGLVAAIASGSAQ